MRAKSDYYLDLGSIPDETGVGDVAERANGRVCRIAFTQPGFVLLNLLGMSDSFQLRRLMLQLKHGLNILHQQRTGNCLVYTSLGRFDQQETTKPHRDGGPDESLLMLGYEPTTLEGLDPARHQILLINNSCTPFRKDSTSPLGVLHEATIENPTSDARRIVNSTMIASVTAGTVESAECVNTFETTSSRI